MTDTTTTTSPADFAVVTVIAEVGFVSIKGSIPPPPADFDANESPVAYRLRIKIARIAERRTAQRASAARRGSRL